MDMAAGMDLKGTEVMEFSFMSCFSKMAYLRNYNGKMTIYVVLFNT